MPEEKSINGGELNPAIITQDDEFNKFLMTLPENQRQTPENKYYTYKMWKIAGKPKDFNQAIDMGLYHWNANDKSYHGNSVIYDEESDVYHFLKPKDHSTVQYELDWYNKGITTDDSGNQYELAGGSKAEWEDFRRNYYLDSSGDDYTYRRRPTLGVSDKARNGIMAALENGVKAALENKISSINQSLEESKVNKFGPGGDLLKAGASFIPIVGTVIDGIELIKDPSWENAGYFAGSLASDVLGLTAIKGLAKTTKVLKAAKALAETEKATTVAKYAKLASKAESINKLNTAKKSARAAGSRGRAYYNDLVANRKLLEAKVAADNAEAKFKLASGVNLFYDAVSQGVQTLEPYVEYYNGGEINKFDNGGDTKATLAGKVGFNPFKAFNRNYRGTNIYESDNFGDAFRQARIDGEDMFVWNDTVYSTELKPNEFVEAARNWDTQGDLAKEDFKMSIIRNPQGVLEHYNDTYSKGKYTTANRKINEYDIPFMYSLGTKGMEDLVMNRNENLNIGDAIWEELANSGLSYEQKIAILANSYHETNGWTALKQYGNGPASGIYMMEDPQREVYNKWLSDNNLTDSYANQTKFVVSLFDNEDSSLKTAWDRAGDKQKEIKKYKDSKEAEVKGYRSAYNHMDYTTKQAFKDWNSSDLDATTTAFEGLFERAGVPALENRKRIAHILSKKYK